MKRLLFSAILLLALRASAQDTCDGFFPFEKGFFLQHTHYDAGGRVTTISTSTVDSAVVRGNTVTAYVTTVLADEDNKEVGRGHYSVRCTGGNVQMDVTGMLNPAMTEAYQSMDMDISGEGVTFPYKIIVGQALPVGGTRIEVTSNGMAIVTLNFEVVDRKVEAKDTLVLPVGKYESFRIRETVNFQAMFLTRSYTTVGWYAKNTGLVRQETYDAKGQLSSRMELTGWGRE